MIYIQEVHYVTSNISVQTLGRQHPQPSIFFARAVVRERRILFEISSPEKPEITSDTALQVFHRLRESAKVNGLQYMTLNEINEKLRLATNWHP